MQRVPGETSTNRPAYEGVSYKWGSKIPHQGLDHFTLANFVRFCHELSPLPDFEWLYQKFTHESFPHAMIPVVCDQSLMQVVRSPKAFDILALSGETISLGTIVETEHQGLGVCHFSPDQISIITPFEEIERSRRIIGVFEVP